MSKFVAPSKVFVASLDYNTTQEALKDHFSQVGAVVEAVIIRDRETKRSRGYGFVTFANPDDANRAIEKLDQTVLDGRTLAVKIAQERN